ncbi:MAG: site-specific DNA-methyltransferase, partial [Anaerolineae bacterium]|nr:site-specific DNA-methyltransferase [Anaerolineae bacterium]
MTDAKNRAPRNRTLTLSHDEQAFFRQRLLHLTEPVEATSLINRTIHQNLAEALPCLPDSWVDLLIIDPPYNLTKAFGSATFQQRSDEKYSAWVESWLLHLMPILKPTASVYICGDWQSSPVLYFVLKTHLQVRNRITWEREKGRGAKTNWKNSAEDIWFCTVSDTYTFNLDAVKLRRKVVAPYR